jgi:hypothetical protein
MVVSEACRGGRTDDERNHGSSVTTGLCQALDELLDLPHFNVLLGLVGLLLFTHVGGAWVVRAVGMKAVGGGLVSRNVQTLFPELRRGPRDGRTGASRCSGRGGGAGPMETRIPRNKYLQALRREWVGRGE